MTTNRPEPLMTRRSSHPPRPLAGTRRAGRTSWLAAAAAASAVALAGCAFEPPGAAEGSVDPPDPVNPNSAECNWTQAPLHFDPCDAAIVVGPAQDLDQAGGTYVYDTGAGTLTDPTGAVTMPPSEMLDGLTPPVRIWHAQGFTIRADVTLRVEGPHPLLVAAHSDISVAGTVDAGSQVAGTAGAGAADRALCVAGAGGDGADRSDGGGGGGGGGFRGPGGEGGRTYESSRAGGSSGEPVDLVSPRGGCPGGDGGDGEGVGGGPGGAGGGAVHLTARDSITVTGTLHAGGAGGAGGIFNARAPAPSLGGDGGNCSNCSNGGGGGGAGGYLALEAPSIRVPAVAVIAANGGGGGGGSDDNAAGTPGDDGQADMAVAPGGTGQRGADGDEGGWLEVLDGQRGSLGQRSGGGGGGGAGFLLIRGVQNQIDPQAKLSPDPNLL